MRFMFWGLARTAGLSASLVTAILVWPCSGYAAYWNVFNLGNTEKFRFVDFGSRKIKDLHRAIGVFSDFFSVSLEGESLSG